jgi:hypothetical protein
LAPKAAQGNTPPPNSFLTTSCTTSSQALPLVTP